MLLRIYGWFQEACNLHHTDKVRHTGQLSLPGLQIQLAVWLLMIISQSCYDSIPLSKLNASATHSRS